MKVVGIYLAAGKSSRMGRHKLALPVGTKTLGSLALQTALKTSLEQVYVIVKETDDVSWLPAEIKDAQKVTIIPCSTASEGHSASLRCGVKQAHINQADAAVILLADQPFITVLMIEEMITCMKETPTRKFIGTSYEQKMMPPILFSSAMYPALLNLTGDTGAKAILRGELFHEGKQIPCADQRLIFDVDTKEDYKKFLSLFDN